MDRRDSLCEKLLYLMINILESVICFIHIRSFRSSEKHILCI